MPSDKNTNPPKPNKDQKLSDLPAKTTDSAKDTQVKGGRSGLVLEE